MLDLFLELCYTIIVPGERVPCKKTNALFNGGIGNCPLSCNKNLTKKMLDIKHKLCYNEYMKRTRKSPKNQKGINYEEEHYDHYRQLH
jgi:hypothetical protein